MVNKDEKNYEVSKTVKSNIANFQLFTSQTDKMTQNIFEITDPYEFLLPQYMEQSGSGELSKVFSLEGENLLNHVATGANLKELLFSNKEGVIYQPDFDSLSVETKEKLKSGIYKIGDSRKVEGNMRAVIVDTANSNGRVEDLTLKEVPLEKNIARNLTDLAIQVQLKQIYEVVLEIQETQEYQLNWDRNNSILKPFLTARTKIIKFHTTTDLNRKIQLLEEASDYMDDSVSAIMIDLISNRDQIEKILKKPIYTNKSFERHANFILEDINLLLKIVGMQTYIDLTLDNESMAAKRFETVKYIFELYSSRSITESRGFLINTIERLPFVNNIPSSSKKVEFPSLLERIHDNYKYKSDNRDLWLNINDEMQEGNQLSLLSEGNPDNEE